MYAHNFKLCMQGSIIALTHTRVAFRFPNFSNQYTSHKEYGAPATPIRNGLISLERRRKPPKPVQNKREVTVKRDGS